MKALLGIALTLAVIFGSTFLIINLTGVVTVARIELWLASAADIGAAHLALIVVLLLFADLLVAIPTLTVAVLAGYFLGFPLGGLSAAAGMTLAGVAGYLLSRRYGPRVLRKIYRDRTRLAEMETLFARHGVVLILLSRALPMLPEVCCCLAGMNRMPFGRFLAVFSVANVPYALIASYAGSRSTIDSPAPAIFTALALSLSLWTAWLVFLRRARRPGRIHQGSEHIS